MFLALATLYQNYFAGAVKYFQVQIMRTVLTRRPESPMLFDDMCSLSRAFSFSNSACLNIFDTQKGREVGDGGNFGTLDHICFDDI